MFRRILCVLVLGVFVSTTGCDDGDTGGKTYTDGPGAYPDSGGMSLVDGPSGTPNDSGVTPGTEGGSTQDGTTPPPPQKDTGTPPPPKKDTGAPPPPPPPAYGKVCTANTDCASNELCVKLASDGYSKSGPPPPKGMCLKKCTNTMAPCSTSATHYYACISAYTWDLGSVKACAVACSFQGKTYKCPTNTYCTRSIGGFMKVCTPYSK
jgi:hypothetical protein